MNGVKRAVRTCVGCRRRAPAETLRSLSLVGGSRWIAWPPQLMVVLRVRSAGRAAHFHLAVECVRRATERGAIEHALRVPKGSLEKASLEQVRQILLEETIASQGAASPGMGESSVRGSERALVKGAKRTAAVKTRGRVRL